MKLPDYGHATLKKTSISTWSPTGVCVSALKGSALARWTHVLCSLGPLFRSHSCAARDGLSGSVRNLRALWEGNLSRTNSTNFPDSRGPGLRSSSNHFC